DDTASIRKRNLRKLRKTDGQSSGIVNTLFEGQEFPNKELAKAIIKAHAVETRRKIRIVKMTMKYSKQNVRAIFQAVQEHMEKQFQVGVSKTKAFKAKAKAEVHLKDDQEHQYAIPRDYYDALKKANLNTTVKIDVYMAHNPHENVKRFKRIYVCLGHLKDGFRAFGRELLGLDGAFIKVNYPGQMITAGLLLALQDLFLAAEHRYCVRHIHDNINLIYKGGHNKELLWKCVTATTVVAFDRAMDEFKGSCNAFQSIEDNV
ncbi:hypothetical protein Tco_1471991, partial [Tanacetum coccineum]